MRLVPKLSCSILVVLYAAVTPQASRIDNGTSNA